jgi:uncharacterized membrane protein
LRRPAGLGGVRRREEVDRPRGSRVSLGARYDPETFGKLSEAIARYFGTARFLAIQSVIVVAWIILNSIGFINHWDPYPFILLNLLFSTQAAYAAPLILLAQNRQDERDRQNVERDRQVAARTQADTEFLARELASVRLALAGMATAEDINSSLSRLEDALGQLSQQVGPAGAAAERAPRPAAGDPDQSRAPKTAAPPE